jgi:signal transduction histidine kinase
MPLAISKTAIEACSLGYPDNEVAAQFSRCRCSLGKPKGNCVAMQICRSIVEAHNGRLWAEPAEGHGSIFRLRLPAAPAAIGSTDNEAAASAK